MCLYGCAPGCQPNILISFNYNSSMAEQAEISPAELKFRFQLNKQLPAAITITNQSGERLAFKVKTTTPKKYVVRPSSGIVEGKGTANVQVIMQAQKELPADLAQCKDKFLVQLKGLEPGEELTQDTFKAPKGVRDTKIRVVLDGPPAPPSPVPEVNEQDDSESTRTGTASAGGHHDVHPAAASGDASSFIQENRALKLQLDRLVAERDDLRSKLDKATGALSKNSSAGSASSFSSIVPVLIVALIAFLVGHFMQSGLPVLQQALSAKTDD